MTKFDRWFKAQFGGLPLPQGKLRRLFDKERQLRIAADDATYAVKRNFERQAQYNAAKRAWEAKEK